jgi:hypothetical protein
MIWSLRDALAFKRIERRNVQSGHQPDMLSIATATFVGVNRGLVLRCRSTLDKAWPIGTARLRRLPRELCSLISAPCGPAGNWPFGTRAGQPNSPGSERRGRRGERTVCVSSRQ